MLITEEILKEFSGVVHAEGSTLPAEYIEAATEQINNYLGFDVTKADGDENPFYDANQEMFNYPSSVKIVAKEIATLLQLEENNNLGINGNNFTESGSRTFLNQVDYTKNLKRISAYRKMSI